VDLSAALYAHIRHLYGSLGVDHGETVTWLGALGCDLRHAVPSFLGLQMMLVEHEQPVTLTEFDPTAGPNDVHSSVRVPLRALDIEGAEPTSMIAFYAGRAGAFVDLAADVGFAVHLPVRSPDDHASEPAGDLSIRVDDPMQPTTMSSGLVGAAELSTINRALGILIGEGHSYPEAARAELARLAEKEGVSVLVGAGRLVRPSAAD
jgi:hypothetical protein